MRINMSTLYAGPLGSFGPGVCDVPDEIAQGLIEANIAQPVVDLRAVKRRPVAAETTLPAEKSDAAPRRRSATRRNQVADLPDAEEEES